jgi:hypothetical protein
MAGPSTLLRSSGSAAARAPFSSLRGLRVIVASGIDFRHRPALLLALDHELIDLGYPGFEGFDRSVGSFDLPFHPLKLRT